ncbi:hypothetical protein VitviT2T_018631 [Vitis vinifera]|uniref:Transmembrane protein n=1 Tax=Vitis vinifera TaxID=29760 RepID=A0ABY9CYM7_VITVI|nr:hypothetical protein VitviT2T_018631 [Vitis vinifera]
MGSDVVFDSLCLDRCLRSGCLLDIVMLLLLGDAFLMGIFPFWMRFADLYGVACLSPPAGATVHSPFGVHSHGYSSTFRISISFLVLAFRAIVSFGVQSHCFHLAFRAIVRFPFGIQSLGFGSTFGVITSFFLVGVQSHCFSLAFRAVLSVWHSKPSSVFHLAFRALVSFWRSEPLLAFHLAFRALVSFWRSEPCLQFGV